ncbi:MAG: hypothetical protein WC531_03450 [Candidatus Paceibacterota bacterium]|jgi:hypothetical protein
MANLLTPETKQRLQRDLFDRKLVVSAWALGLFLIIIIVILGSIWASLFIRASGLASLSASVDNETKEVESPSNSATILKEAGERVKILNDYWSEPLVSALVVKAIGLKPTSLKISGLALARGELGQPIKLSLVGLAETRASLVDYVNLLKQDKFFTKVDLPVESLISDTGGQFIINLEK